MNAHIHCSPIGDCALLIALGNAISDTVNHQVRQALNIITQAEIPAVLELVPAFATLTVHYDPCLSTYEALQ